MVDQKLCEQLERVANEKKKMKKDSERHGKDGKRAVARCEEQIYMHLKSKERGLLEKMEAERAKTNK